MTTNEKICKWLGLLRNSVSIEDYYWHVDKYGNDSLIRPDFLHDRNQQKWIEDKIIKKYNLYYYTKDNEWVVLIEKRLSPPDYDPFATGMNQSKDLAFIQAVEQLIDKETSEK